MYGMYDFERKAANNDSTKLAEPTEERERDCQHLAKSDRKEIDPEVKIR